eukprot:900772-Lingulodinium_polyedra.AAC.1
MCSGTGCDAFAMDEIGIPYEHTFIVEKDKHAQAFIAENHKNIRLSYTDIFDPVFDKAPRVDIVVAGFPCQGFSVQGLGKGPDDPRSSVLTRIMEYILKHRPRCVLLENVPGLVRDHMDTLLALVEFLGSLKTQTKKRVYNVRWTVLDSSVVGGVPQHRPRLYIVAWKQKASAPEFSWPGPIPMKPLSEVLDKTKPITHIKDAIPKDGSATQIKNVTAFLKDLAEKNQCPVEPQHLKDYIVNDGGTRVSAMHGKSPCLTASRGTSGGYWIPYLGRRMAVLELLRLQGMSGVTVNISEGQMGKMAGNAFTQP